jgi:hypothetical protein
MSLYSDKPCKCKKDETLTTLNQVSTKKEKILPKKKINVKNSLYVICGVCFEISKHKKSVSKVKHQMFFGIWVTLNWVSSTNES